MEYLDENKIAESVASVLKRATLQERAEGNWLTARRVLQRESRERARGILRARGTVRSESDDYTAQIRLDLDVPAECFVEDAVKDAF